MAKLVFIENQRPITDSLKIAVTFGKRHDNVIQDIRSMECSKEFSLLNFQESNYSNERGKNYPKYLITQDGFSFLAMGYTGKEAARFKELYINEFNKMREQLSAPQNTAIQSIDPEIAKALRLLVTQRDNFTLFNMNTNLAFLDQVIDLLGQSKIGPSTEPKVGLSASASLLTLSSPRASFDEKWYLTAELGKMIGVSTQMVASMASRHGMRIPEYCRLAKTDPNRISGLVQVMYNEKGKDKLFGLLSNIAKRSTKRHRSLRRG